MNNPEKYLEKHQEELTKIIGEASLEYYNYINQVRIENNFNSKNHLKYFLELIKRPFDYIKSLKELSENNPVEIKGIQYKSSGLIICMMLQQHAIESNILLHNLAAANLKKIL